MVGGSAYQSTVKRILGGAKGNEGTYIYTMDAMCQSTRGWRKYNFTARSKKLKKKRGGNKSARILICKTFSGNAATLVHDVLIIHVHMALPWSSVSATK